MLVAAAAEEMGHTMRLLDIGGGFTGHFDEHGHVMFGDIARTINKAISVHFPAESNVRVIAEPGRYFAETSASLVVPVYGKRDRIGSSGGTHKDYWLTDGLYGSFNCIIYDGQKPQPQVLRSPLLPALEGKEVQEFQSTLWGPTCDSADYIYKDIPLPELRNGDWLLFGNSGAYTVAGACDFNGIAMTTPNKYYVCSQTAVDDLDGEESSDTEGEEEESEEGEEQL
jgi:ornithine decarboxylase